MANLIVTVIAIALVAVAALMGAYYGGSAFLQGTAKANAATLVNQGSQIAAGWVLYTNENSNTAPEEISGTISLGDGLVPDFVTENPDLPANLEVQAWDLLTVDGTTVAYSIIGSSEVCERVQGSANGADTFQLMAGETDADIVALVASARYGCGADAALPGVPTTGYYIAYKIQ